MTIHLGCAVARATSLRPTRAAIRKTDPGCISPVPPLFGLAPGGVCRAVPVARTAVRSYRTLSPLLRAKPKRFAFCGTFPGVTPAGRYPAPCFRGARTFLPRKSLRTRDSGHPAGWLFDFFYMALPIFSVQWRCRASSPPISRARVARVDSSALPSTRAWRKWRWKAAMVTSVATSKRPVRGTS